MPPVPNKQDVEKPLKHMNSIYILTELVGF